MPSPSCSIYSWSFAKTRNTFSTSYKSSVSPPAACVCLCLYIPQVVWPFSPLSSRCFGTGTRPAVSILHPLHMRSMFNLSGGYPRRNETTLVHGSRKLTDFHLPGRRKGSIGLLYWLPRASCWLNLALVVFLRSQLPSTQTTMMPLKWLGTPEFHVTTKHIAIQFHRLG